MPEGHTIHRLAAEQQELVGRRLAVTSPQGRFARDAAILDGRVLAGVEAKGKHLLHHFETDGHLPVRHLHVHLGMQGKFLRDGSGRPPLRQARVRLEVPTAAVAWELVAPSRCELLDDVQLDALLEGLGPDPLRDDADARAVQQQLADDDRSIGVVLLDQSVLAGAGNVFRAEVLHACRIHPRRPASSLSGAERSCLWETLREMMKLAVDEGRILTIPAAPGVDRSTLPESEARFVYKQARCRRCGAAVDTGSLGGRTSYTCPSCQPLPT